MLRGVPYGPYLHFRTSRRNPDHYFQIRGEKESSAAVHLFDKASDHHFGGIEVRYHSVTQRPYCLDARIDFLVHQLGFLSECYRFACIVVYGDDARFVKNDFVILENDRVRRSEVHRKFLCQ